MMPIDVFPPVPHFESSFESSFEIALTKAEGDDWPHGLQWSSIRDGLFVVVGRRCLNTTRRPPFHCAANKVLLQGEQSVCLPKDFGRPGKI